MWRQTEMIWMIFCCQKTRFGALDTDYPCLVVLRTLLLLSILSSPLLFNIIIFLAVNVTYANTQCIFYYSMSANNIGVYIVIPYSTTWGHVEVPLMFEAAMIQVHEDYRIMPNTFKQIFPPWFLRSVYILKCSMYSGIMTCSHVWFTTEQQDNWSHSLLVVKIIHEESKTGKWMHRHTVQSDSTYWDSGSVVAWQLTNAPVWLRNDQWAAGLYWCFVTFMST